MTITKGLTKEGRVYEGYFVASEIDSGSMESGKIRFEGTFSHMEPWNGIWHSTIDSTVVSIVKEGEEIFEYE